MNPYISIIIPFYNRERFVKRVLDSVYSQGLAIDTFEVICVDDGSPTEDNYIALNNYVYGEEHPNNLIVVRHECNKCQGGARNTGISLARGEWILHLDSDDVFMEGSLSLLYNELKLHNELDILMYDYSMANSHQNFSKNIPIGLKLDGLSFVKKYKIPWVVWCYAFKRSFILDKGLKFEENVRMEDGDYVHRAVMCSSSLTFVSVPVVFYAINDDSVMNQSMSLSRVEWNIKMGMRFKDIAENFMSIDYDAAMVCLNNHYGIYKETLSQCLKCLPYTDIVYLLSTYKVYKDAVGLLRITNKYPRLFAISFCILRPFYRLITYVRNI